MSPPKNPSGDGRSFFSGSRTPTPLPVGARGSPEWRATDWEPNAARRDRLVLQELRFASYLGGRAAPWGAGGAEPSLCRTRSPNVGRSHHLGCEIPAEMLVSACFPRRTPITHRSVTVTLATPCLKRFLFQEGFSKLFIPLRPLSIACLRLSLKTRLLFFVL